MQQDFNTSDSQSAGRRAISRHFEERMQAGLTLQAAINEFQELAQNFELPYELKSALRTAWGRGGKPKPSGQTLRNWYHEHGRVHRRRRRPLALWLRSGGLSSTQIAKGFGVSTRTARNWVCR